MAIDTQQEPLIKTFPIKPKLKPTSKTSKSQTPESKYWKSFKPNTTTEQTLISSITNLSFSPISPHDFVATHSASVTIFSSETLKPKATISSFKDTATAACYRSDGLLLAAGCYNGQVQVFDVKKRSCLRRLSGHSRPVHFVSYPFVDDKLHLFSGGDDSVVKYWDVMNESLVCNLLGHKDYVRCGAGSPVSDDMFVTGSYDHTVKVWDVRVSNVVGSMMSIDHGAPVEDVIYLPSGGGLIATAGGNSVKIWDVIGGGKLLYSMESHNKTVTKLCVGKIGNEDFGNQYRILSVSLDGYLKAFDYSTFKITSSIRFPSSLMSVAFSHDCSTRVVGASNGIIYAGKRKSKDDESLRVVKSEWGNYGAINEPKKRVLRPSYFRYFDRGQSEKPSKGDYLIMRPKKVKLAEHDKLLRKFHHKEALVSALKAKKPESVVAVMEELVSRKKLLKCVSNLEVDELGLLLTFLQRHSTMPWYAGMLILLAKKVVENRIDDISGSEGLKVDIRNLKRSIMEEMRIQQSLQEIQGIISPLLKIAG